MNRRNFLKSIGKICAVLPFVDSSSAVGDSGASEGKSKAPMCATEVMERREEKGKLFRSKSTYCDICYEDCPHFLQCHGYDSRYIEKYNVWCALKLNPEHKNIPGAKEWLKECEDMMNTPEMKQRFYGEFGKILK